VHAEANAFYKIGKSHRSAEGASLYVTLQPCLGCAMDIIGYGIKEVFWCEVHDRHPEGIEYLEEHGITVKQIKI